MTLIKVVKKLAYNLRNTLMLGSILIIGYSDMSCSKSHERNHALMKESRDSIVQTPFSVKSNPVYRVVTNQARILEITEGIVIQEKISVQQVFDIGHREFMANGTEGKFVVYMKLYDDYGIDYATFAHLPECDDCHIDSDGHKILAVINSQKGQERQKIDSLLQ
jgi:hypothetical protein